MTCTSVSMARNELGPLTIVKSSCSYEYIEKKLLILCRYNTIGEDLRKNVSEKLSKKVLSNDFLYNLEPKKKFNVQIKTELI